MHKEYAVEPAAMVATWETFRRLIDLFGSDKGRLVSRLPGKWERRVIKEAKNNPNLSDVHRKNVVICLKKAKHKIADFNRHYDPKVDWISNALHEHEQNPFDAIICLSGGEGCAVTLRPDDDAVDDAHPFFAASVSKSVPRTADEIAKALFPLAMTAWEIDIVDPYFDFRETGENYFGPLSSLLEALDRRSSKTKTIRIHARSHESRPSLEFVAEKFSARIRQYLPQGYDLELYEWQEHPKREDFHDRYFLTDVGGIMVGAGFAAAGGQENATFSLLGFGHSQELRERFKRGANVYDLVGKPVRINADGTTELLD